MAEISRFIGLATLLIAIPLLGIAWMLASNLSSLLILNERRKLGLMRLRGVPGKLLGQSLLISIGLGGLIGGTVGLILGTLIPLIHSTKADWFPGKHLVASAGTALDVALSCRWAGPGAAH